MEAKHTPGPWTADLQEQYSLGHCFVAGDNTIVAQVECGQRNTPRGTSKSEAIANARLIAAAPDLLAALEWFSEFCAEHPEWTAEQFPADCAEGEWLEVARAALAKAKGGA